MTDDTNKKTGLEERARKTRKKKRRSVAQIALDTERTLYCRFPFDPGLEEFETVDFPDIEMAKAFVEDTEVESAVVVNGSGSYVAAWVVDRWFSYA